METSGAISIAATIDKLKGRGRLARKNRNNADFTSKKIDNQKTEEYEDVFADNQHDHGWRQYEAGDAGVARGKQQETPK